MCCKKKVQVKVLRVSEHAVVPSYATAGAAAADVKCIGFVSNVSGVFFDGSDCIIAAGEAVVFKTGLHFEVPEGYELEVHSRSGHGFKNGLRLSNCTGIIDSDYRGELMVKLHNDSKEPQIVKFHERICQVQVKEAVQHLFEDATCLSSTARGEGGLGSTGLV